MDQTKNGLSSIARRLSKLEHAYIKDDEDDENDDNVLSQFVTSLKKQEKQEKKQKFDSILKHYIIDIQNDIIKIDKNNITDIIIFTIRYVEANSKRIASFLQVPHNSAFKKGLCLSFLKNFDFLKLTDEFYNASIDSLCKILYMPILQQTEPINIPDKKKKGFFK